MRERRERDGDGPDPLSRASVGAALGALAVAAGLGAVVATAGRSPWGVALLAVGWLAAAVLFAAVRRAEREPPFGARALERERRWRSATHHRPWPPLSRVVSPNARPHA